MVHRECSNENKGGRLGFIDEGGNGKQVFDAMHAGACKQNDLTSTALDH